MASGNEALRERIAKLERLAMLQNTPTSLCTTKKTAQDSDDHSVSRHRRHPGELHGPHSLPPPPPSNPKSRAPPSSHSPGVLIRMGASPAPSPSCGHPPWMITENLICCNPNSNSNPNLNPILNSNPNSNINSNPNSNSNPNPNSNSSNYPTLNLNPNFANGGVVSTSHLLQELEMTRRRSIELEELVKKAEHEAALLRADKACMVQALDYTRQDNNSSLQFLVGEEAECIVELVRSENMELLEMVEEQHSLLAQQQARASSAEREVHRLHDEVEIMKSALQGADERTEVLSQRAEAAERLLAMLLKMTKEESLNGNQNGSQDSVGRNGFSVVFPSLSSLPPLPPLPPLPQLPPNVSNSSHSGPLPAVSPPPSPLEVGGKMEEVQNSSQGTPPPPPSLSAIGRVLGQGILTGEDSPKGQKSPSQKILQQQQQLLLALLQKGNNLEEDRRQMSHWSIHVASLVTTAAATVVVTVMVLNYRRRS